MKKFLPILTAITLCAPLTLIPNRSSESPAASNAIVTTIEVTQLIGTTRFLVAFTPGRSFSNTDGLVNWDNGGTLVEFRYFPSDPNMIEAYLAVLQFPGQIQEGQNNLGGIVQYRDVDTGEVYNCAVVSGSADITEAGQTLGGSFTMFAEQCASMQSPDVEGIGVQINGSFENVRPN